MGLICGVEVADDLYNVTFAEIFLGVVFGQDKLDVLQRHFTVEELSHDDGRVGNLRVSEIAVLDGNLTVVHLKVEIAEFLGLQMIKNVLLKHNGCLYLLKIHPTALLQGLVVFEGIVVDRDLEASEVLEVEGSSK